MPYSGVVPPFLIGGLMLVQARRWAETDHRPGADTARRQAQARCEGAAAALTVVLDVPVGYAVEFAAAALNVVRDHSLEGREGVDFARSFLAPNARDEVS